MPKLDLNKTADFAIATMSNPVDDGLLNVALQALGRTRDEWDIEEARYRGGSPGAKEVFFHIFTKKTDPTYQAGLQRVVDRDGRRKAKFAFPYVDGQTTDDLGRAGGEFEFECMLHGRNYRYALKVLRKELHDPIPGELMHPVLGIIPCGMVNMERVYEHSARNAVVLRLTFTEHNFSTIDLSFVVGKPTVRSALQAALSALQKISAAIAAVRQIVGIAQSIVNGVIDHLNTLGAMLQDLLVDSASSYGVSSRDIAAVLPVNLGGTLVARGASGSSPTTTPTSGIGGTSQTAGNFTRVSDRFTAIVPSNDPYANLPLDLLGDVARQAIEQTQLERRTEDMRSQADVTCQAIDAAIELTKQAALGAIGRAAAAVVTLSDARVTALNACDAMAQVLRAGSQSGRPTIISYVLKQDMSLREVAFVNGLTAQDGADIALLNPSIESVNNIAKGTSLKVPVFR